MNTYLSVVIVGAGNMGGGMLYRLSELGWSLGVHDTDALALSRAVLRGAIPFPSALEATRKLIRSHPDLKVVAVTVCEEDPFPTRLLQAGAAGYLTKGAALEEMVQAIRMVFSGQRYISPQIAQQLALKSFQPQSSNSPFDLLSEREIQIALMIAGCQKVQAISDKLCLSPKTVNTYRYRIFEKLSITSDVELALLAVRHGMIDANT